MANYKITGGTIGSDGKQGATTVVTNEKKPVELSYSSASLTIDSSEDVEGNLNFRRLPEKKSYNKWLLGDALRVNLGHPEDDGNTFSTPPVWTKAYTGVNQAFVMSPLEADEHEVVVLNAYDSGSVAIEGTVGAASSSQYYSKRSRFVTKTYSVVADAALSGTSDGVVGELVTNLGNMFTSYHVDALNTSRKANFDIDVPDYGKITNIRVWVEIVSSAGNANAPSTLDGLVISLVSPNVSKIASYPWMTGLTSVDNMKIKTYTGPFADASFDKYILFNCQDWESDNATLWGKDKSLRVIFDDAATQRNNSHYDPLFRSGTTDHQRYLLREGSPNYHFSSSILGWDVPDGNLVGTPEQGNGISWITDPNVINDVAIFNSASDKSPPQGWLTGPGGIAAVGEYETTGSNLGPAVMRPLYPLLDDIEETIELNFEPPSSPLYEGPFTSKVTGKRKGLRGTEMHGKWQISVVAGHISDDHDYYFFRQARLEITYDENSHLRRDLRDYRKSPHKKGKKLHTSYHSASLNVDVYADIVLSITTNVNALNIAITSTGLGETYISAPDSPGRTFGITADTGSSPDYAVFTRLTGTLSDRLATSLGFQHDFLNNEFGTPYIPLSSGSGVDPSFDTFTDVQENKRIIAETLNPQPLVSKASTLTSAMTRFETTKKTRDLAAEAVAKISGSA